MVAAIVSRQQRGRALDQVSAAIGRTGPTSTEFLGVPFSALTKGEALALLGTASEDEAFRYVVTPNVDHMVRLVGARPDEEIWQAYQRAALVLCDSRILALLARTRGVRLSVVPGSDVTPQLMLSLIRPGDRVTLIGSDAGALDVLRDRYQAVEFHQHIPPMGLRNNPIALEAAAEFVRAHPSRFVLLAVGSPQQELLALSILAHGGARGWGLCIGASIDFMIDRQKRAPRIMQRLALEWLHRLASNPRRMWRRYLVDGPKILAAVARWKPSRH